MSWPMRGDDGLTKRVAYRNLACVWANFAAAGGQRLLPKCVLEQRSQLQELEAAIPGAEVTVVRLRAPLAVVEQRLQGREPHAASEWHLGAARWLTPRMDVWAVEDHLVDNGDRPLEEVAREALWVAGWLP
jgi:predicted kinase